MKIGIEAQRLLRSKKHGMDIVALELIKALQEIDHEHEYVIFTRPGPDAGCIPEAANFKVKLVDGWSYPYWEQVALPRAVAEEGIDLLHCTNNTAPIFISVPTVITLHDIIYLENKSIIPTGGNLYQNAGNVYRKYVVPSVIKRCSHILTVSNFERDRISTHFKMEAGRISTVYNAVGNHFSISSNEDIKEGIRLKYGLPEKYIFFLGNTAPKKNLKGVLEAFIEYASTSDDPVPLVIADYDQGLLERYLENSEKSSISNMIRVLGYVDNTDLPLIYEMAELFLYPSFRESFGIPILEAMACGTPVVTSQTSAMPEIAGGAAYLVDPKSPMDMVKSISDILQNAVLRESLCEKGLQRAQQFSWKRSAERVREVYAALVSEEVVIPVLS